MREEFYENSVGPQNEKTQRTFYLIYSILFYLSLVVFFLGVLGYLWFADLGFVIFLLAPAVILGVITFFVRRRILIYFDYTFISGEIRIIKVINGKSRRKFLIFDSKSISQIGKFGSESFEKLMQSGMYKIKFATPNGRNAENQLFYIAAKIDGENNLVVLECKEQFLSFIVSVRGRSIIEKDYA